MALLSDTDLEKIIVHKRSDAGEDALVIDPYSEICLTPVGYDFRVGELYASSRESDYLSLAKNERITIKPHTTVLVETLEWLGMPKSRRYSGIICSLVSLVSEGFSHISTTIDADWHGKLLIAVHNHASTTRHLEYGQRLCTAIIFENSSPTTRFADLPPSRTDILLKTFSAAAKRAKRRKQYYRGAAVLVFGISIFVFASLWGIEVAATAFLAALAGVTMVWIEQR